MKTTLKYIFTALMAASAASGTLSAANDYMTSDIAPYVYPQNRPATPPNFTYAPDGNGYLMLSADHTTIDRYDIASGKKIETIFDATRTRENSIGKIDGFLAGSNERYIMVYCNSQSIYRRSFTAEYYVYEVPTRVLRPLSTDHVPQRAPVIAPNGRMIAFVGDDNNIYIRKLDYNTEVAVTKDGAVNKILNGVPDWVYEEEFSTTCSMVWAPDNLTLSFLKYNESDVPMYSLPIYRGTCDPRDEYTLYPGMYSYKYPVAGEPNSKVTLHAYDVDNRKVKDVNLPDSRIEYIPRIDYGPTPEQLMVTILNRDQNRMEIYSINPKSTVARSVYVDESKAWISESYYQTLKFLDDKFIVMSGRSGFDHLYSYNYSGALMKSITSGKFDVTDCYGYDAKGNFYYQAASPTPLDRVVYRIDVKGVVSPIGEKAGTNTAVFNDALTHAMYMHSDCDTPPVYTIIAADGKLLRTLEDNKEYARRWQNLPKKEFFTMTSDGYTLNGYLIKPAGASAANRCPVIMYQYSGPGSQTVLHKWGVDWEQFYAQKGYAIVCVDGRGTGGRGREFMEIVYRDLGHYETIDQVNAARYAATLDFVDPARIGIFGWSYGGYETLMAASQEGAPYAAAVAVAPVTDWRFYDSVYTERFMLTPQQNEKGYDTSSAISRAGSLVCPLLIMYGTSDDNVHPYNSIQYVSELQSLGGYCDMMVFPNMNHSINYCNARAVVYAKMLDYFNKNLR